MNYDTLVLSGGGAKGIAQLGALYYFKDLSSIKRFVGTSIGSVICLLLICGYTPIEIYYYLIDQPSLEMGSIFDLWENLTKGHGLLTLESFIDRIKKLVIERLGELPNLSQLYEMTGKELVVCVTNKTKRRPEYFSYETEPEIVCTEAIKISCSLPFVFVRQYYKGCYYLDGGLMDNFPLGEARGRTLGISSSNWEDDEENLIADTISILSLPILAIQRLRGNPSNADLIELIFDRPFVFPIEKNSKEGLFLSGYKQAEARFATR